MKKTIVIVIMILITFSAYGSDYVSEAIICSDLQSGKVLIDKVSSEGERMENLISGIVYHNLAINLPEKYTLLSIKCMDIVLNKYDSSDVLALAYKGSAITLLASVDNKKGNFIGALSKLETGADLIDKAVSLDPDNITLRILRISNGWETSESSPVSRMDAIADDLDYLDRRIGQLSPEYRSFLFLYQGLLGIEEDRIDESISCFEHAIQTSPGSIYAMMAMKNLMEWEE